MGFEDRCRPDESCESLVKKGVGGSSSPVCHFAFESGQWRGGYSHEIPRMILFQTYLCFALSDGWISVSRAGSSSRPSSLCAAPVAYSAASHLRVHSVARHYFAPSNLPIASRL